MHIIYILNDLKCKLQYNIIEATWNERVPDFKCDCCYHYGVFSFHVVIEVNVLFLLTVSG
jgi:hypothetical protein